MSPSSFASLNTEKMSDKGYESSIRHPRTNLPTGVFIGVFGRDSERYQKTTRKQQNRRMESMKGRRNMVLTAEELEVDAVELLAACTGWWRTFIQEEVEDDQGNKTLKTIVDRPQIEIEPNEWLDFSPENAVRFYSKRGFAFAREQVDQDMGDRSNFLPA